MSAYAQDYGYFFNSTNSDRTYNAESFETWLKPFFKTGVFEGGLKVKAQDNPDMTVIVEAGYADIDGKLAFWPSSNIFTISNASGVYSRIDTIVLRRDNENRCVSIEVVTGTAAANPQPTAPTRTDGIYELVIAQILVGVSVNKITTADITDTRADSDLCGYVTCPTQEPDYSDLYDQFTAQFQDWFDEMKDQLSEDAAGHLQLEIDDIEETKADMEVVCHVISSDGKAPRLLFKGQYVAYNGHLYQTNQAILQGNDIITGTGGNVNSVSVTHQLLQIHGEVGDISNLTTTNKLVVPAINELADHLANFNAITKSSSNFTLAANVTAQDIAAAISGNVVSLNIRGLKKTSAISSWTTVATVPSTLKPIFQTNALMKDDTASTSIFVDTRITTDGEIQIYALDANHSAWGCITYIANTYHY